MKKCLICGAEYDETGVSSELRCGNCGETRDYISSNIDVGTRQNYETLHNLKVFFDNNNFQNVINTVEANRDLLNFPYAKFLYGLSIWYSERVKNIEKAEPILIEAIRSANTYDSANSMASYAADLMANYAVDKWGESADMRLQYLKEFYNSQADYEVASANGGTLNKMSAKSMLSQSKKQMNGIFSLAVKVPLSILKVAYLMSGNYDMLDLGAQMIRTATSTDSNISLDLSVMPLVNFFNKSIKNINKQSVVAKIDNSKINPSSPITIKNFSVLQRDSDEQKYVNIEFEATNGIDEIEFSVLPLDATGKNLYCDDSKYIYYTAKPIVAGKNSVTVALPCANRMTSVVAFEQYIKYMSGESEVFLDSDLIDAPTLNELTGTLLEAHERLLGKGVRYQWREEEGIWICPCGKTNSQEKEVCLLCGRNLSDLREKASNEKVESELETIRRETAHSFLKEYRYTGIELNTSKAVFKYDLTECVLKKDDSEFNKDTAVYLTDLGTSIVYINANDGCLYSVDLKDFSKKKVFSEKANSVYLCNDKLYVASDRTVHILNSATFAEEASFRASITTMCSADGTVYYLENNGHAIRINSNGKHDKLSSHVVAMAVVGNKIVFNGKKGLTIADINKEKQKVGFLRRSFLTNERYVSGSAPTLLAAFYDVVYYADNSGYGTVDIVDCKAVPTESISLISIYNTNSTVVGITGDFKQISLKK